MFTFHQELIWKNPYSHYSCAPFDASSWLPHVSSRLVHQKPFLSTAKEFLSALNPFSKASSYSTLGHHHHESNLLWQNPMSAIAKGAKSLVLGENKGMFLDKFGGKKTMLEKVKHNFKHRMMSQSALQKILKGAMIGATAEIIYSCLDNYQLLRNKDYWSFFKEVSEDAVVGCVLGGGIATVYLISLPLGIATTLGFAMVPSFNAAIYEGVFSVNFWRKFGMAIAGLFTGTIMLPLGAVVSGGSAALAAYLWNYTMNCCYVGQQQKLGYGSSDYRYSTRDYRAGGQPNIVSTPIRSTY